MNLDDALQTFIAEARDLLEQMEDALLRIEHAPDDIDTINAIFRAAHTIKGSAGLFGLDGIVAFTHVAESVLDKVRSNELAITPELVALLLQSGDHMRALIDHVANGGELAEDTITQDHALVVQLSTYLGGAHEHGHAPTAKVKAHAVVATPADGSAPVSASVPAEYEFPHTSHGGGAVETDRWHLSLRFGRDVLRDGMDPLSFIRYLASLGEIVNIITLLDAIPGATSMDPESCYLGFEIGFKSDADKATIEGVFEFVQESSRIRILPPRSKITEYWATCWCAAAPSPSTSWTPPCASRKPKASCPAKPLSTSAKCWSANTWCSPRWLMPPWKSKNSAKTAKPPRPT
ncbi:MAG: two-component system chemotaxis family sensor kinase CheA [Comamonadaceae bacterium]|nr:MAG: two-component system chemotaxis family sensor kinase CheA [Comamonadaceae bacterium]